MCGFPAEPILEFSLFAMRFLHHVRSPEVVGLSQLNPLMAVLDHLGLRDAAREKRYRKHADKDLEFHWFPFVCIH